MKIQHKNNLPKLILILSLMGIYGCTQNAKPIPYKIISTENNNYKNSIYYKIELLIDNDKKPTKNEIEATFNAMLDSSKRTFSVGMYIPVKNKSSSSYARCSRMPEGTKDCGINSSSFATCSKLYNGEKECIMIVK